MSDSTGEHRTADQAYVGKEDIHRDFVQYRDGLSRVRGLKHLKPLASKGCGRMNPLKDIVYYDQHDS